MPLPQELFETGRLFTPRVDRYSQITVRTNRYSVPTRLIGKRVHVVLHASHLVVYDRNVEAARHERLIAKGSCRLDLDHYLEALIRKPGGARPPRRRTNRPPAHPTRRFPGSRRRPSHRCTSGGSRTCHRTPDRCLLWPPMTNCSDAAAPAAATIVREKPSDSAPPARLDRTGRRRRDRLRLPPPAAALDPQRVLRYRRPGDEGPDDLPRLPCRAADDRVRRPLPTPPGTADQGSWLPTGEVAAGLRLRRQPQHRRGHHPHPGQL
ncbi:hypothetical protein JOF59_005259 [Streptomyces clavifer]|uniref:Transposase for insertion sequence element IS21-like C-terminal domain-containing protein n=1 Tax=Streptomyces clavifer TaxID=68188 RepID=A0ABS4VGW3_9ACTN|nr:hypothetical protein [Streptomyces clavifer]